MEIFVIKYVILKAVYWIALETSHYIFKIKEIQFKTDSIGSIENVKLSFRYEHISTARNCFLIMNTFSDMLHYYTQIYFIVIWNK